MYIIPVLNERCNSNPLVENETVCMNENVGGQKAPEGRKCTKWDEIAWNKRKLLPGTGKSSAAFRVADFGSRTIASFLLLDLSAHLCYAPVAEKLYGQRNPKGVQGAECEWRRKRDGRMDENSGAPEKAGACAKNGMAKPGLVWNDSARADLCWNFSLCSHVWRADCV